MTKRIIVHPGLPKTGTTYLQREIFTRFPIGFVSPFQLQRRDVNRKATGSLFRQVRETMLLHDSSIWDKPLGRNLASSVKSLFEEELRQDVVLISFENLIALDFFSAFETETPTDPLDQILHIRKFVDLIAPNRDSLSVILTLRRQPEFLASLYSQYTNRIPFAGTRDFERQVGGILSRPGPSFLDYDWLLSALEDCLEPDFFRIFPLENFGGENLIDALKEAMHLELSSDESPTLDLPKHNVRRIDEKRPIWEVRPLNFRGPGFARQLQKFGAQWRAKYLRPKHFGISPTTLEAIANRYFPSNENLPFSHLPIGLPDSYFRKP
jgi:hypothetical protein